MSKYFISYESEDNHYIENREQYVNLEDFNSEKMDSETLDSIRDWLREIENTNNIVILNFIKLEG